MVALKLVANISKLNFVSFCVVFFFLHKYPNSQLFLKNWNSSHTGLTFSLPTAAINWSWGTAASLVRTLLYYSPESLIISAQPLYHLGSLRTDKQNGVFFPALIFKHLQMSPGDQDLTPSPSQAHIIPMLHRDFRKRGNNEPWVRVWSPGF